MRKLLGILALCFSAMVSAREGVIVHVPPSYTGDTPVPLVIELHGHGSSGPAQENYLDLTEQSDLKGFILVLPEGEKNRRGDRYWNAWPNCCSGGTNWPDDSAYLSDLIDTMTVTFNIDPKRVYFVGHSNGGYMAHRMACDHADQIAAVVSLSSATIKDQSLCNPSGPVAVLEIHGTADRLVRYDGLGNVYPGALETAADWAAKNHCWNSRTFLAAKNLTMLPGKETDVLEYGGCDAGGAATLWTVNNGTHIPLLSSMFNDHVANWLYAHAKP
jgi:polyhydroxybutyrate depolymerase